MKNFCRTIIFLCIFLIVPIQRSLSQVILTPHVSGSAFEQFKSYCFGYYNPISCYETIQTWTIQSTKEDECHVSLGTHSHVIYRRTEYWAYIMRTEFDFRTILEFEIAEKHGENPFPPPWMTTWNWKAELQGFKVIAGTENPFVMLFKQRDYFSDGILEFNDFHSADHFITYLFEEPPPQGSYLDPIDITNVLREDIFGVAPKNFTGFVLKTDKPGQIHLTSPHIVITDEGSQTPLPTPQPLFRVTLDLSGSLFLPGDLFKLDVHIEKPDSQVYINQPLIVLLDVHGEYFFYPSWHQDFDFSAIDIDEHIKTVNLLDFVWPDITGSASGLVFYAAILNPSFSSIAGNWDSVTFGWTKYE